VYAIAQRFQPDRLTLIRELRQFTRADLAERIHRTAPAISQFESGTLRPDGLTIGALALALGVRPTFFSLERETRAASVEECHFRSLRSATQRERRCLIARGALVLEVRDMLQAHVDFPSDAVPRISREVATRSDIERCASEVRRCWGLNDGPLPNIVWLLEGKGVLVSYIPSDFREVDAFSGWQDAQRPRPFVFLTRVKDAACRARFDAAHELGHLVMHAEAQPGNAALERQANAFASAFLMPEATFSREAPTSLDWDAIWALKRRWRASARAILYRAHELGTLSDASYRRGFVYLNQRYGQSEPHEPPFEEAIVLSDALKATAADLSARELAVNLGISVDELLELLGTRTPRS
jgi:Zn-dependent peptidase ImmA (M78 family)